MRYLRLALVIVVALFLRGTTRRNSHFDLSANYSTRLTDRGSLHAVTEQLHSWERELRAHGFNSVATAGGSNIKGSANGKDIRTESREVTLVGKLDHLGRVRVRIRTDEDLDAQQQAFIELQAQRKSDYADAWEELGKTAQHMLQPRR